MPTPSDAESDAGSDPGSVPAEQLLQEVEVVIYSLRVIRHLLLASPSVLPGADPTASATTRQVEVLRALRDGPKSIRRLETSLAVAHSTAAGLVTRLERMGLVRREGRDPSDRRVRPIALTARGRELADAAPVTKRLGPLLEVWTAAPHEDRRLMFDGVTTLRSRLEALSQAQRLPVVAHSGSPGDLRGSGDSSPRAERIAASTADAIENSDPNEA